MRNKIIFPIIVLALAALAIAACSAPFAQAASPAQTAGESDRTLSINGHGEVSLTPDIAYLYIGVHTENEDAGAAVAANNAQVEAVMDALIDAGIQVEDISTSNFSLWTSQNYDFEGQPTDTKFVVDNTVFVVVRDLDQLGDMLGTAIDAGANTVNGISFDVSDKSAALSEARRLAVEDARAQAEELAALAGVELGEIRSISMFGGFPGPFFEGRGGGGFVADAQSSVPITPGEYVVTVDVNIEFEIE